VVLCESYRKQVSVCVKFTVSEPCRNCERYRKCEPHIKCERMCEPWSQCMCGPYSECMCEPYRKCERMCERFIKCELRIRERQIVLA